MSPGGARLGGDLLVFQHARNIVRGAGGGCLHHLRRRACFGSSRNQRDAQSLYQYGKHHTNRRIIPYSCTLAPFAGLINRFSERVLRTVAAKKETKERYNNQRRQQQLPETKIFKKRGASLTHYLQVISRKLTQEGQLQAQCLFH